MELNFIFLGPKAKQQQFELGSAVDISSLGPYQTNNIKRLGAELQQVLDDLRAIGEEMRLAGIEAKIFHLQKEHNSLRIAYSAEQDKIAPTNKGRAGGIDLDPLGNYLSSRVATGHEPFRFADPSHPANDMAVFVEEFDRDEHPGVIVLPGPLFNGIAYDTVVDSLESLSDTPKGVDAHVINRMETSSRGQHSDKSIVMNLYPSMPKKMVEMTGWHEGGHAVERGYFNNLPQARQKPVIEAFEAWLRKLADSQLAPELAQAYTQYKDKLFAREYIDHSENPFVYFVCFTEVFAELRGIYKFSLTGEAAGLSYKELLSARTAHRSEGRAGVLEDAEQLYETLKREVFEPYHKGDRVSAPPQMDPSTSSGPGGETGHEIADPSEQRGKQSEEEKSAFRDVSEGEAKDTQHNERVKVVQEVLQIMQRHSLYRDKLDWQDLNPDTLAQSGDITEVLRSVLAQMGDNHSFWHVPKESSQKDNSVTRPTGHLLEQDGQSVGVLTIPGFVDSDAMSPQEFSLAIQRCLSDLSSLKPTGWIIDLRGNWGGNMWPMLAGLSPFFENGDIGYFDSGENRQAWFCRDGAIGFRDENGQEHVQQVEQLPNVSITSLAAAPVVVLINNETASSAEAVAIAFQKRPNTYFVGQPTAGLTSSNRSFPLSDGSTLELTVALFADRNGDTHKSGIQPDQEVQESSENPGQVFSVAIQSLNSITSGEAHGPTGDAPAGTDTTNTSTSEARDNTIHPHGKVPPPPPGTGANLPSMTSGPDLEGGTPADYSGGRPDSEPF